MLNIHFTQLDLVILRDTFLVLMVTEGIVKPVAIRIMGFLLHRLDRVIGVVPDWLYRK